MEYEFIEGKGHDNIEWTITGSHGDIYVESITGEVIGRCIEDPESDEYAGIIRINLEECCEYHKLDSANWEDWSSLDILDVGCWFEDGTYSEAEPDFRNGKDRSLRVSEIKALGESNE
tara:strand:- start:1214 stop:1567 length:354 start_codon:yes stop_codon:yes gene_type:complete